MEGYFDSSAGDAGTTWVQGVAHLMALTQALALIPLTLLLLAGVWSWRRRRQFWCYLKKREVEVEFEERGLPGLRHFVAVTRCSAFEPGAPIECGRQCTDAGFRRRWEAALPVSVGGDAEARTR